MTVKRLRELESFLKSCDYDTIDNPKGMREVDYSKTPKPIVELFYESGFGNYPEDLDAGFQPPEQDEFAEHVYEYCRRNSDEDNDAFRPELRDAWLQRCKKAWASLVRDVHFAFLTFAVQEKNDYFDAVWFTIEDDIERGADLVIVQDGTEYHVNLFIDSKKSQRFVDQKKNVRQPAKQAVDLEVPMTYNGPKKEINDIWLFNKEHVAAVAKVILNDKNKVEKDGYTLCKKSER